MIAVASSGNGTKLIAAQLDKFNYNAGHLYTSADSGRNWKRTSAPSSGWQAVASSSDGKMLLAAQNSDASGGPGRLYTSADSGVHWTAA